MKFKIKEIILWPRQADLPPRRVRLDLRKVNVISGGSRTGKSAIIPIIDYCLAAGKCAIPVETIRDSCSWFGILAETEEGEKLFARREPGEQASTGDMYLVEGESVPIPDSAPAKNTTADAVRTRLDELSGLSRLDFDFEGTGSGFKRRLSFRDLVAFTFQPQYIVANPRVLFFKADTYEHQEKLKMVFPYVLKAVTADILAAEHELRSVRRELARKQRELENLRRVSTRWLAELRAWALQAREFGLVDQPIAEDADRTSLMVILEEVVEEKTYTVPSADGINEAINELVELEDEERTIATELRGLRRRLGEMLKLKENSRRFKDALTLQRDRLAVSKWIHSLEGDSHSCPVCDSPLQESSKVAEMIDSLAKIEAEVHHAGSIPPAFDREMVRATEGISLCVEKLGGIAVRKNEAGLRSDEAQRTRFRQSDIARFLGRVEKGLEMHYAVAQDSALAGEVDELRRREEHLAKVISRAGAAARRKRALEKVAGFAGRLLPDLDTERPHDPIELSIADLTIKVKGQRREDYLWEIGSGANWLSYHLAMSLALQQFFLDSPPNPVPSFLVYDQPSQVYFPRRLATPRTQEQEDPDPQLRDEDVEAVRKVFQTIAQVVRLTSQSLQVLVLDHAGPDVWKGIDGVHLVEEWRDGKKLVPTKWLV